MSELLPAQLELNAWTGGREIARSSLGERWDSWAFTGDPVHTDDRTFRTLASPADADQRSWRSESVGWGLILPDTAGYTGGQKAALEDAPKPILQLLEHRKNSPVFRYRADLNYDKLRRYRPNGSYYDVKLSDTERGIGENKLPQYLLICGSPVEIPWRFQYVLDQAVFAGRLDLDTAGLSNYVSALVQDWAGCRCRRTHPVIWATDHGQDDISWLMRYALSEKMRTKFENDSETKRTLRHLAGPQATGANLLQALEDQHPALVITTSHGMTGPLDDVRALSDSLGLLVDAGRTPLSLDGVRRWQPEGAIWYAHACCSAGCDRQTSYAGLLPEGSSPDKIVKGVANAGSLTAPLPRALLGAEKPLRAFIGHVEPTFNWTLRDPETGQVLSSPLCQALYGQLFQTDPIPVSMAFQHFYRQAGTLIAEWVEMGAQLSDPNPEVRRLAPQRALRAKLTATDHQACVVLGDPTVALPKPA